MSIKPQFSYIIDSRWLLSMRQHAAHQTICLSSCWKSIMSWTGGTQKGYSRPAQRMRLLFQMLGRSCWNYHFKNGRLPSGKNAKGGYSSHSGLRVSVGKEDMLRYLEMQNSLNSSGPSDSSHLGGVANLCSGLKAPKYPLLALKVPKVSQGREGRLVP